MEALTATFPDLTFFPLPKPSNFDPATIHLAAGHSKGAGRRPFGVDTTFERDVQVAMRDGAKIYTDIFRPSTSSHVSEGQSYARMGPYSCGLKPDDTSGYEKFEGPDPADWCARGYAIINPDARGAGFSEGDVALWGEQEAHDFHDLIDWASKQPWCNGSVATAGNSWLAIAQINVASRDPHPALKAIAPWEAATDTYRDFMARGGIPRGGFLPFLYKTMTGNRGAEDGSAMVENRPLFDAYWESKVIPVEKIDIPTYLTASYSTGLHSRGSFETFEKIRTPDKWLRVHRYQEWYDLYRKTNIDELQAFFDKYCKNVENEWEDTPRLRLSLLAFDKSSVETIAEKPAPSFPLPGTEQRKYFLDARNGALTLVSDDGHAKCSYKAHHLTDCAEFRVQFEEYTELAGYPSVKLFISCDESDDMDVNVQVRKIGADGTMLSSLNYPVPVPAEQVDDTNVAKFIGCDGMLRASHRVSRISGPDAYPVYKHDKVEKIAPGTVVELNIQFWPIGMVFDKGEGIVLRIAGHELRLPELKLLERTKPMDTNVGKHWVHTGGSQKSCLTVPVVTSWS
ncbi:hypothetical protein KJ359_010192 [Pestalotiopsis sp. 9143b]|nr:hypothetical protein KJ359_010192 [Pestalotiopsis sp. 9143b]